MDSSLKHQLIIIDGGEAFESDAHALESLEKCNWDLMTKMPSWKKWISDGLNDTFQTIRPDMPNTRNAKYAEWKVWFEKYFRYIAPTQTTEQSALDRIEAKNKLTDKKIILIWHSLGATFLVKYLSENQFPRHIDGLHLVSPVFDDIGLIGESLATFRFSPHALPHFHEQAKHLHIWASTDDTVVPYDHSVRFHVNLIWSVLHTFHDRGHFIGQSHFVELFEEILKTIH
jgi:predicted alpha/beta hydrolase family esterase